LFQYLDESGVRCAVDSSDVNRYIRELAGEEFTAKDFRTWAGSVLASRELYAAGPSSSETAGKKTISTAVKSVARQLGNRPATCRKYYVHPAIFDAYLDGSLFPVMDQGKEQDAAYDGKGLRPEEYCVLVVIAERQQKLAHQARTKAA